MPWLIRSDIARRLASFFKLVSPPNRIWVYPTVMPTAEYNHIMKEDIYIDIIVAGNVVVSLTCMSDEELSLLYGHIYMDNDVTVATRYINVKIYYEDDNRFYTNFTFAGSISGANTNYYFNKENITDYLDLPVGTYFQWIPNELIEGGEYRITVTDGQAGDQMVIKFKLQSIPAVKEFL